VAAEDITTVDLPPALKKGDRVRLVSPASFPSVEWLNESIHILESWGFVVEVGRHAMAEWGYMAGRDHERIADLNDAFRDPGVRAVITTRGGAGAYRIADGIDFDAVRRDPKPLVGFSDITNLHLAIWKHCRVPSIHGCLAGANAQASVRHLLTRDEPLTVTSDPSAYSAAINVPGVASGPLIGGNIRETANAVGCRLPDMTGAILFLEDERKIGLGQVDRQLTHLLRSGSLDGIVGVALGLITGFDDYVDCGWTLHDVLRDQLEPLGVPVLGGLKLGHGGVGVDGGPDQFAATIGATATLDATLGTLTVGPCVRPAS
jgi:muramoyltetrapeptide carboxypeptidase